MRPMTAGACLVLLAVGAWSSASTSGSPSEEPVGVVRTLRGSGRILSATDVTPVYPFAALSPGDTVVVDSGRITILDCRGGGQHVLTGGSRFVMPFSVVVPDTAGWIRVLGALQEMIKGPSYSDSGVTRGAVDDQIWPASVGFGSDLTITFLWRPGLDVEAFNLQGPLGNSRPALTRSKNPAPPLSWPSSHRRVPGRYRWELRGRDGTLLGDGEFQVLTARASEQRRNLYVGRAGTGLLEDQTRLIAEILAARDGLFLWE